MLVSRIVSEIDAEILNLQKARALLVGGLEPAPVKGKPGRPKGSKNIPAKPVVAVKKRKLSPEGRKRIAEAMKKRWAERRKQAAAAK